MKRVAFLGDFTDTLYCLAKEVAAIGYAVDIYIRQTDETACVASYGGPQVRFIALHNPNNDAVAMAKSIIQYIIDRQLVYDFIHANSVLTGTIAGYIKAAVGTPYLLQFPAVNGKLFPGERTLEDRSFFPALRSVITSADSVLADITCTNFVSKAYGFNRKKIIIITAGRPQKMISTILHAAELIETENRGRRIRALDNSFRPSRRETKKINTIKTGQMIWGLLKYPVLKLLHFSAIRKHRKFS